MSSSSAPRSTDPGDVMLASRLTVVRDEIEAETICGLLRTEGIACEHRQTDMGAGAWEATGSGGPREILVAPSNLERARELIKPDTSGVPVMELRIALARAPIVAAICRIDSFSIRVEPFGESWLQRSTSWRTASSPYAAVSCRRRSGLRSEGLLG